jgi:hypothetical protein
LFSIAALQGTKSGTVSIQSGVRFCKIKKAFAIAKALARLHLDLGRFKGFMGFRKMSVLYDGMEF